jgi:hypothetical protein
VYRSAIYYSTVALAEGQALCVLCASSRVCFEKFIAPVPGVPGTRYYLEVVHVQVYVLEEEVPGTRYLLVHTGLFVHTSFYVFEIGSRSDD